jgi:hypothetical protein
VIGLADERWEPVPQTGDPESGARDPRDRDRLWDVIVEVIDLENARLLSTQRFDGSVAGFIGDGRLWQRVADPQTGVIRLEFLRLEPTG